MDAQTALAQSNYANTKIFTLPMAAEVWGLRKVIARRLDLEPDDTYVNEYGKTCALYTRESVLDYYDDERVVRARHRSRGPRDWARLLVEEYTTPGIAVPAAARAAEELFRTAFTARGETKARIHELLLPFTALLYRRGHCVGAVAYRPVCRRCDGSGCRRCPDERVGFTFQLGRRLYRWSLRAADCVWIEPEEGEWVDAHEAPPRICFSKHYALIEWVLEGLH